MRNPVEIDIKSTAAWKESRTAYGNSMGLFWGRVKVAEVFHTNLGASNSANKYQTTAIMTGLKSDLGLHQTEELAMVEAEKVFKYWINKFINMKAN